MRSFVSIIIVFVVIDLVKLFDNGLVLVSSREYYYTRTRRDPNHLRISEEFKNQYTKDVKYESLINGTKYEYYKSNYQQAIGYDELIFETIDKIFQHRLSAFYLHHYDNDDDRRRSSDPKRVSHEQCARDLLYLIDKIPMKTAPSSARSHQQLNSYSNIHSNNHEQQQQQQPQQQVKTNQQSRQDTPPASMHHDYDRLTPELTALFDSYARQEAGLLMGNTYWVGAYDQCVNRHIFDLTEPTRLSEHLSNHHHHHHQQQQRQQQQQRDQKVISFRGRYCVASLKAPIWDEKIKQRQRAAKNYFKTQQQFKDYSKLFRLQVGICLPDSCDSTSIDRHSGEIKLLTTSMLESRYADYQLIDLYCLPDETSPLREWSHSAIYFLVFLTIWLTIVFLATVADVFEFVDVAAAAAANQVEQKQQVAKEGGGGGGGSSSGSKRGPRVSRVHQLVCWFSLRANYVKLMKVSSEEDCGPKSANQKSVDTAPSADQQQQQQDQSPADKSAANQGGGQQQQPQQHDHLKVNLRFLNAFKVIIMFWIINGHIMLLMIQTAKNILYSDALLNGLMHFLIGATFGVDLFFTMTGFLTSYLIFNSGHAFRMKPGIWLYLSFHRYWRLAPMYLLSFWFSRSVMQLLGSGPLWDYGTSSLTFRGLCNTESWWYPLTLTSNLHGLFEECMITSWYISCDMQFWLVSPIFITLLARSPLAGWTATLATILASSKVRYDSILSDKSARYDELVQPRADIFMRVSHDLPALYTHPHYRIAAYLVGLLAGHYVYMIKSGKWKSILSYDQWTLQQQVDASSETSSYCYGNETLDTTSVGQANIIDKEAIETTTTTTTTTEKESHSVSSKLSPDSETLSYGKRLTTSTQSQSHDGRLQASRRLRNGVAYLGLSLFLVMSFVSYLLSHHYPTSMLKYAKQVAAAAYSIDHLLMSIGASLVIVSMCFGQWKGWVRLLSHPNWTRLSKINYALLLLQCEAIYYQIFRFEQVPLAGTRELINILFNLLVTLYPIAFGATLVFEFPLANIEKLLLP